MVRTHCYCGRRPHVPRVRPLLRSMVIHSFRRISMQSRATSSSCILETPRSCVPNALPSRRERRAPPGHGGGHGRRPSAPHAGTPGNGGPESTRPAPRRADPRVPGFQFARLPPTRALPRPPVAPAEVAAGARNWKSGILATWGVRDARQDPRFPDSPARRLQLAPGDRRCGLRLADAVIALASRPWSKHPLSTATARAVKRG